MINPFCLSKSNFMEPYKKKSPVFLYLTNPQNNKYIYTHTRVCVYIYKSMTACLLQSPSTLDNS